eukprot:676764-Rhodomonas_salina.1
MEGRGMEEERSRGWRKRRRGAEEKEEEEEEEEEEEDSEYSPSRTRHRVLTIEKCSPSRSAHHRAPEAPGTIAIEPVRVTLLKAALSAAVSFGCVRH